MRSIYCPRTGETATVLGNTSEGATPIAHALLALFWLVPTITYGRCLRPVSITG